MEYWLLMAMCILTAGNIIMLVATIWISFNTIQSQTTILHMTTIALNEQSRMLSLLADQGPPTQQ